MKIFSTAMMLVLAVSVSVNAEDLLIKVANLASTKHMAAEGKLVTNGNLSVENLMKQ